MRIGAMIILLLIGVAAGALLHKPLLRLLPQTASESAEIRNEPKESSESHPKRDKRLIAVDADIAKLLGIEVATAESGLLVRRINVPGSIVPNPKRVARIPARVVGTVAELRKQLGDAVFEGETVAVLDSREVADAKSEYLTASVNYDLQKTLFDRAQVLWNKKISAEQLYLQTQAQFTQAQLRLDLARQKLWALNLDATEVAKLAKQDGSSQGVSSLRRYDVRSPITGRVIERKVDVGAPVGQEGQIEELYVVADLTSLWAELAVPTADLDEIREGQHVALVRAGTGHEPIEGKVVFISPTLNQETRSARVIAEIDNKTMAWRPGAVVQALIEGPPEPATVIIPKDAIQTVDGQASVFVPVESGFRLQVVKLGRSNDKVIEILKGVNPGDKIATGQTFALKSELEKGAGGDND